MTAKEFMNLVANGQEDFLQDFLDILTAQGVRFCVIGGLAVNAYAEPVVSLDLDIVVTAERLDTLTPLLAQHFTVKQYLHSLNVSSPRSDLRIQLQTDPRYQEFIGRATTATVLGYEIPVAAVEDVLQGKVWACLDTARRPSKRQKDLADITRLVETRPHLMSLVPAPLRERLFLSET